PPIRLAQRAWFLRELEIPHKLRPREVKRRLLHFRVAGVNVGRTLLDRFQHGAPARATAVAKLLHRSKTHRPHLRVGKVNVSVSRTEKTGAPADTGQTH